jgi:hypothetical protein
MEDIEVLPEITIRQRLSIQDFIDSNPYFVALDDDYIEAFAGELLGKQEKGSAFLKLHKRVLQKKKQSLLSFSKFLVNARRKNFQGRNLDKFAKLRKEPYYIADRELKRLANIFDAAESDLPKLELDADVPQLNVWLSGGDVNDATVVVYDDEILLPVETVSWSPPERTYESYVFDETHPLSVSPTRKLRTGEDLNTVLHELQPKFQDLLHEITDIHTLKVLCSLNAIDFDDITNDHMKILQELTDKDHDDKDNEFVKLYDVKHVPKSVFKDTFKTYSDIINIHIERVTTLNPDKLREHIDKINVYTAAQPRFNWLDGFPTPYELAQQATLDMPSAIQAIQGMRERLNWDNVYAFNTVLQLNFDGPTLQLLAKKLLNVQIEDTDDTNDEQFVISHEELNELRQGYDTSMYANISMDESAFIDDVGNMNAARGDDDDGGGDGGDSDDDIDLDTDAPPDTPEHILSAASKSPDHLLYVIKRIQVIVDNCGLPWNMDAWINNLQNYVFPASRYNQLVEIAPHTSTHILEVIAEADEMQNGLVHIENLSNEDQHILQSEYPKIYAHWLKVCDDVYMNGIVFWALDTLESSVAGNLDQTNFIGGESKDWSYGGPPLEKSTSGVLVYIANIVKKKLDDLLKYAENNFPEKLQGIHEYWISHGKKPNTKSDKIAENFTKFLKENKKRPDGKKPNEMSVLQVYIPQYLNLPNLPGQYITGSKQAAWAKGCCLAKLDANYQSDVTTAKEIMTVKKELMKKRWLKKARPVLYVTAQPITQSSEIERAQIKQHDPVVEPSTFPESTDVVPRMDDIQSIIDRSQLTRENKKVIMDILKSNLEKQLYYNILKYISQNIEENEDDVDLSLDHHVMTMKRMIAVQLSLLRNAANTTAKEIRKMVESFKLPSIIETQAYINEQRERIKVIKLRVLDGMERDDKRNAIYASRIGVQTYVDVDVELQKWATTEGNDADGGDGDGGVGGTTMGEADEEGRAQDAGKGDEDEGWDEDGDGDAEYEYHGEDADSDNGMHED